MKKSGMAIHANEKARAEFIEFSAGRDVTTIPQADSVLIPCDLWTNRAHAIVLWSMGIYSQEECSKLLYALGQIEEEWQKGQWELDPRLEDVHINLEARVTELCGESIGGRLHSGRSRNDQVATDMKLYTRRVILQFIQETLQLIRVLIDHAREHAETVMPGYTHHRKATITSWGHWCASYAQGLLRDTRRFADLYQRINTCPLGAAASYGTTWPLNRELAAELLAFDAVQPNTLDAVISRGEAESETALAIAQWMKRLSRLSQDIILFSTEEFGYLSLPHDFTTGSSIMPQKRNPDFAEAIKGKSHVVMGLAQALLSIDGSNLAGYNKDVQWSKYLFMDAVREGKGAAVILANVIPGLIVHRQQMEAAARTGFLNAVDIADYLARVRGRPFRETHEILSKAVDASQEPFFNRESLNQIIREYGIEPLREDEFTLLSEPKKCLLARQHTGSPHPERLGEQLEFMQSGVNTFQFTLDEWNEKIQGAQIRCQRI